MKKIIFIFASIFVICFLFYYHKNVYSWLEFRENTDTPDEFLNVAMTTKENYSKDSLIISDKLKHLLSRHESEDFFYSKEYFEGTSIIIDTIIYSPELTKLGIFVITKNPTSRQLLPSKDKDYYYNATAYLCVRQQDTLTLTWLKSSLTNSTDKSELSKDVREAYFRTFVSKDTTEKYAYKYNLDDIRFWTSSVWRKIEEDNVKRKEFEEEKIKHPENIYEPQKR